jgi:hypothetical protein
MGLIFFILLKKHVEKMSAFRLPKMFMKQKELKHPFQYVDEKKVGYWKCMA